MSFSETSSLPAALARVAAPLGACVLGICLLLAYLTLPRSNLKVTNASGQAVAVTVRGADTRHDRALGMRRTWAVEQHFAPGEWVRFRVRLPGGSTADTSVDWPGTPLSVAVDEKGRVAPR